MKEVIQSITEFFDEKMYSNQSQKEKTFDGFKIVTNQKVIILAIDNEQQCCEHVGYFMTNDNINEFIGAELNNINYIDGDLKVHTVITSIANIVNKDVIHTYSQYYVDIRKKIELGAEDNYALFVNFETNKGQLQFVAYNAGNGYYGHDFELMSKQLNYSTTV